MVDKILKKQENLQRIRNARARWWKKLSRATLEINKLNDEERRLLKPRKLELHEVEGITSKEWHKIKEQDFDDAIPPW